MKLEHVLLRLLATRSYSGYDLRKWLAGEGQFVSSRLHHSQIYRTLARMADRGWVVYRTDPRDGRPDAKVYRLTERGQAALLDWLRSPYQPTSRFTDSDFLNRFLIAAALDRELAIRLVTTELAHRREQIARFRPRDRTIAFEGPMPGLDPARHQAAADLVHQYGAGAVDGWVAWLQDALRRLEADALSGGTADASADAPAGDPAGDLATPA
ncbi:PadR family transcriptional regulator [Streptomyces sp. 6N223]|uniref:PadR family transcriptional regulator n=1 Tax=Streptomyces sp. 6N223 TaxID=3457412 RepID=UPI003FD3C11F